MRIGLVYTWRESGAVGNRSNGSSGGPDYKQKMIRVNKCDIALMLKDNTIGSHVGVMIKFTEGYFGTWWGISGRQVLMPTTITGRWRNGIGDSINDRNWI